MNAEQQNKVAGNVIIALIAGLILGFIAGSAWASHKAATNDLTDMSDTGTSSMLVGTSTDMDMGAGSTTATGSSVSDANNATSGSAVVSVGDQKAGNTVVLSHIDLPAGEWVAVRDNFTGKPEYVLGAAWFAAGNQDNVTVHLSRTMVAGTSYQIVLFKDDGNHVFNYTADNMINANTNPVVAVFTAH